MFLGTTKMLPPSICIKTKEAELFVTTLAASLSFLLPGKSKLELFLIGSSNKVDDIYSESECGFRSGRGTIDMIFSLRQVAEKVREKIRNCIWCL